jgi:hypothetical protein
MAGKFSNHHKKCIIREDEDCERNNRIIEMHKREDRDCEKNNIIIILE